MCAHLLLVISCGLLEPIPAVWVIVGLCWLGHMFKTVGKTHEEGEHVNSTYK